MKQNPNWTQFKISSSLGFNCAWIRGGSFSPNIQGSGDNSLCVPDVLPKSFVVNRSVPVHGITKLCFRSHPNGSFTHETVAMAFSLLRSDKPVYTTTPFSPCTLLGQWQDLSLLTSGIPIRPFQPEFTIFTDASTQGWGTHMGDSQLSGIWTRSDCKLHINTLKLKAVILAFHQWVSVSWGH